MSQLTLRITLSIILIIFFQYSLHPESGSIGKIVKKKGTVEKSNLNCDSGNCKNSSVVILPGDRITTGKNSSADIILNDGTSIRIMERSDLIIYNIISKKKKTPTDLFSDYGKYKIIQQNDYLETSLIFKTRNCVVKSVCSSMSLISGASETGLFVYNGEAGFANIDPSIIKAYIVKSGYESFIKKNHPPITPRMVPASLRLSWLQRYYLSDDIDKIIRYNKTGSAVEWFFTEK
jgi:hypothetical protein